MFLMDLNIPSVVNYPSNLIIQDNDSSYLKKSYYLNMNIKATTTIKMIIMAKTNPFELVFSLFLWA